jgi:hypothetical protein
VGGAFTCILWTFHPCFLGVPMFVKCDSTKRYHCWSGRRPVLYRYGVDTRRTFFLRISLRPVPIAYNNQRKVENVHPADWFGIDNKELAGGDDLFLRARISCRQPDDPTVSPNACCLSSVVGDRDPLAAGEKLPACVSSLVVNPNGSRCSRCKHCFPLRADTLVGMLNSFWS